MTEDLNVRVEDVIRKLVGHMFSIPAEQISKVDSDADFFSQMGIGSLEAFDAVVTLHEILDVEIPREIDPESLSTLRQLSAYIVAAYPEGKIRMLLDKDVEALLEERVGTVDAL